MPWQIGSLFGPYFNGRRSLDELAAVETVHLSGKTCERVAFALGCSSCFECRFRNVQILPTKYSRRKPHRHTAHLSDEFDFKLGILIWWNCCFPNIFISLAGISISFKPQICWQERVLYSYFENQLWNNHYLAFQIMEVDEDEREATKPPLEPVTKKIQLQTRGRVFGVVRESYLRWEQYLWRVGWSGDTHQAKKIFFNFKSMGLILNSTRTDIACRSELCFERCSHKTDEDGVNIQKIC